MDWMRRMMYGRYGMDQLGFALIGGYFVCYLLSVFFHGWLLHALCSLCLLLAFYRMLSRQIDRRRAENEKFLVAIRPLVRWYNVRKCRRNDRDHCYFKCPNCGQQLRAPKGKGKISVTCRNCGATFEEKT